MLPQLCEVFPRTKSRKAEARVGPLQGVNNCSSCCFRLPEVTWTFFIDSILQCPQANAYYFSPRYLGISKLFSNLQYPRLHLVSKYRQKY